MVNAMLRVFQGEKQQKMFYPIRYEQYITVESQLSDLIGVRGSRILQTIG